MSDSETDESDAAEETYDLTFEDLTVREAGLVIASLGNMMAVAGSAGRGDDIETLARMQGELLTDHPEAGRRALLETDIIKAAGLPEEYREMIDVEVGPGGEVHDARDAVDIDID